MLHKSSWFLTYRYIEILQNLPKKYLSLETLSRTLYFESLVTGHQLLPTATVTGQLLPTLGDGGWGKCCNSWLMTITCWPHSTSSLMYSTMKLHYSISPSALQFAEPTVMWNETMPSWNIVWPYVTVATSQLVTRSTRHSLKSCDELTILLNRVVTSWPHFVMAVCLFLRWSHGMDGF